MKLNVRMFVCCFYLSSIRHSITFTLSSILSPSIHTILLPILSS